ncbi:unnamed protein product [Tilletia controversa]|uniref:Uncharacterized protein n=1 Tax=Tilletia caries TaxID=13290 RepID=A0ABN7IW12_9BASI|nr:unnamed protein product [Tilletia caries]CAD6947713.1 unnamed protein product [Tilletia controversa]
MDPDADFDMSAEGDTMQKAETLSGPSSSLYRAEEGLAASGPADEDHDMNEDLRVISDILSRPGGMAALSNLAPPVASGPVIPPTSSPGSASPPVSTADHGAPGIHLGFSGKVTHLGQTHLPGTAPPVYSIRPTTYTPEMQASLSKIMLNPISRRPPPAPQPGRLFLLLPPFNSSEGLKDLLQPKPNQGVGSSASASAGKGKGRVRNPSASPPPPKLPIKRTAKAQTLGLRNPETSSRAGQAAAAVAATRLHTQQSSFIRYKVPVFKTTGSASQSRRQPTPPVDSSGDDNRAGSNFTGSDTEDDRPLGPGQWCSILSIVSYDSI